MRNTYNSLEIFKRKAEQYISMVERFIFMYSKDENIDIAKYKADVSSYRAPYISDEDLDFIYRLLGIKNTNAVKKAIQHSKASTFLDSIELMLNCSSFKDMKIKVNTLLKIGYLNSTLYNLLVELLEQYDSSIKKVKDIDEDLTQCKKKIRSGRKCGTIENLCDKMLHTEECRLKFRQFGIDCKTPSEVFENLEAMCILFDWLNDNNIQIPTNRIVTNEIHSDTDLQNYINLKDNKYQLNLQAALCSYVATMFVNFDEADKLKSQKDKDDFKVFSSIRQYPNIVGQYFCADDEFGLYLQRMLFNCSIRIPLDASGSKYSNPMSMSEIFRNKNAFRVLCRTLENPSIIKLLNIQFSGTQRSRFLGIQDELDGADFVELTCKYRIRMSWILKVMSTLDKLVKTRNNWNTFYY